MTCRGAPSMRALRCLRRRPVRLRNDTFAWRRHEFCGALVDPVSGCDSHWRGAAGGRAAVWHRMGRRATGGQHGSARRTDSRAVQPRCGGAGTRTRDGRLPAHGGDRIGQQGGHRGPPDAHASGPQPTAGPAVGVGAQPELPGCVPVRHQGAKRCDLPGPTRAHGEGLLVPGLVPGSVTDRAPIRLVGLYLGRERPSAGRRGVRTRGRRSPTRRLRDRLVAARVRPRCGRRRSPG
jgi:hypothetical protein